LKYVLFYESADDVASKAPEEFASADPFVLNGVIRNWYVREWHDE
jgi:uncharacterized protein YciI